MERGRGMVGGVRGVMGGMERMGGGVMMEMVGGVM